MVIMIIHFNVIATLVSSKLIFVNYPSQNAHMTRYVLHLVYMMFNTVC